MRQESIDTCLHQGKVLRISGSFITACRTCSIVIYGRRAAPEIFIVCKFLPDISIPGLAVGAYPFSHSFLRSDLRNTKDKQRIEACKTMIENMVSLMAGKNVLSCLYSLKEIRYNKVDQLDADEWNDHTAQPIDQQVPPSRALAPMVYMLCPSRPAVSAGE